MNDRLLKIWEYLGAGYMPQGLVDKYSKWLSLLTGQVAPVAGVYGMGDRQIIAEGAAPFLSEFLVSSQQNGVEIDPATLLPLMIGTGDNGPHFPVPNGWVRDMWYNWKPPGAQIVLPLPQNVSAPVFTDPGRALATLSVAPTVSDIQFAQNLVQATPVPVSVPVVVDSPPNPPITDPVFVSDPIIQPKMAVITDYNGTPTPSTPMTLGSTSMPQLDGWGDAIAAFGGAILTGQGFGTALGAGLGAYGSPGPVPTGQVGTPGISGYPDVPGSPYNGLQNFNPDPGTSQGPGNVQAAELAQLLASLAIPGMGGTGAALQGMTQPGVNPQPGDTIKVLQAPTQVETDRAPAGYVLVKKVWTPGKPAFNLAVYEPVARKMGWWKPAKKAPITAAQMRTLRTAKTVKNKIERISKMADSLTKCTPKRRR